MVKIVRAVRYALLLVTSSFLALLLFSFYTLPDEIDALQGQKDSVNELYTLTYEKADAEGMKSLSEGSYKVKISLFKMPIKDSVLNVKSRHYVAVSGDIIGLRLFSRGVMIVSVDTVETAGGVRSPGKEAGLAAGDIICRINDETELSLGRVTELIRNGGGELLEVEYMRNGEKHTTTLLPAYGTDSTYKGGLWIRDSAAGIGTVSFYDVNTGLFASLGHAVCDIDTGEVLPLLNGDVVSAQIVSCNRGVSGKAGELCGRFNNESIGVILHNGDTGVYGVFDEWDEEAEVYPVATFSEIETGMAQIYSTVDSGGKALYDIEILKIDKENGENKNMVIEVTDEELIEKTGGIVQGMSGSPIIQNGRLVGVVTHVLVNNPKKGYGIFATEMIEGIAQ